MSKEQIIDALMELRQEAFIQTGKSLDHDSDIDAAYWDGKSTAFFQAIDLINAHGWTA
jgi:hypothetical protein|tara:strand:+ start:2939 stop:3112 length:174 start_codon:yes stop_codon:yes gene_type:complete